MKTSRHYLIPSEYLHDLNECEFDYEILGVSMSFKAHGHYRVTIVAEIDGHREEITGITTNMQLVDAWKSGSDWVEGEDGFDTWYEVLDALFYSARFEDRIEEIEWEIQNEIDEDAGHYVDPTEPQLGRY